MSEPSAGAAAPAPVEIHTVLSSPHVLGYRFEFSDGTPTVTGKQQPEVKDQVAAGGDWSAGTQVKYVLLFIGNPNTTVLAAIEVFRNGASGPGATTPVRGTADADGLFATEGSFTL